MKHTNSVFVVAVAIVAASFAVAQEKDMPQMSAEQQAAMDALMKAASPGAPHERLAQFEGNWTFTSKMWMAPGAPPETWTGTTTYKMVLGGRYLRQRVESPSMMGMPFDGIGYTGYDNVKGMYVGSWIDNLGTGILMMEGAWDESTNALEMKGETPDPSTGKSVSMRMVIHAVTGDSSVVEFYQPGPDGQEFKNMEITYARSAAPAKNKAKKDKGKR